MFFRFVHFCSPLGGPWPPLRALAPLITDGSRVLAMKAAAADQELADLPAGWHARVAPLSVPGLAEARVLVIASRAGPHVPE